jgi:hypothetical protein
MLQRRHELSKKNGHMKVQVLKKRPHEGPCMRKEKVIAMPSRSFYKGEGKTPQMEPTSTSITHAQS